MGVHFTHFLKSRITSFSPLHTLSLFSAGDVHLGAHHDVLRLALDGPPVEPPSGSCYENRQGLEAPSTPCRARGIVVSWLMWFGSRALLVRWKRLDAKTHHRAIRAIPSISPSIHQGKPVWARRQRPAGAGPSRRRIGEPF